MVDLSILTETDVGRRVKWLDEDAHEGYLVTWNTRQLIVDEKVIGGRGRKSLRVFVDPSEADFLKEEK